MHLGSMPEDSGSIGILAQILALSDGHTRFLQLKCVLSFKRMKHKKVHF